MKTEQVISADGENISTSTSENFSKDSLSIESNCKSEDKLDERIKEINFHNKSFNNIEVKIEENVESDESDPYNEGEGTAHEDMEDSSQESRSQNHYEEDKNPMDGGKSHSTCKEIVKNPEKTPSNALLCNKNQSKESFQDMFLSAVSSPESETVYQLPPKGKVNKKCFNSDKVLRKGSIKSKRSYHHCSECNKQFFHKQTLVKHMRTHNGEKNHKCEHCSKQFIFKSNLVKHMLVHTGERNHSCDICGKCFALKATLLKHAVVHSGEKKFECNICQKKFSYASCLKRHMVLHTGEKNYKCKLCDREFSQIAHLTNHVVIHTGVKKYHCDICDKKFSRKPDLIVHQARHTGFKRHQCDVCDKGFYLKSNLIKHMRIHTGVKSNRCDRCRRDFFQRSDLEKHKVVHTNEKYECPHCGKLLSRQENLNRHLLLHSVGTCYRCPVCGKSYNKKGNLQKHLETHSGQEVETRPAFETIFVVDENEKSAPGLETPENASRSTHPEGQ